MRSTPHCLRRSSMKSATVFAMWRSSRQLFLPPLRPPLRWPSLLPPPLPPVCFLPPFFEAPAVLEILAARSLLMPFLRRPSYCLSFLTLDPWSLATCHHLLGVGSSFPSGAPHKRAAPGK